MDLAITNLSVILESSVLVKLVFLFDSLQPEINSRNEIKISIKIGGI